MAVRLRLQRHGRIRKPFYHIVAADARSKRDGRIIERIGWYNPTKQPAQVELDKEKALKWLLNGAQPSDTVRSLLKRAGVMHMKHLQRGIRKGALTQEEADKLSEAFLAKRRKRQKAKDVRIVILDLMEDEKTTVSLTALDNAKAAESEGGVVETVTEAVEGAVEAAKEIVEEAVETVKEVADAVTEDGPKED